MIAKQGCDSCFRGISKPGCKGTVPASGWTGSSRASEEGWENRPHQPSVRFGLQKLTPLAARRTTVCEDSLGSPRSSALSIPIFTSHWVLWCQDPVHSSSHLYPTSRDVSHVTPSEVTAVQAHALGVMCLVHVTHRNPMCGTLFSRSLVSPPYLSNALTLISLFDNRDNWQRKESLCHRREELWQNLDVEAGRCPCLLHDFFSLPLQVWKMWLSSWTWRLSFISLISLWPSR